MSKTLTWNEVLKRDDLIGGDIESVENGITYRGPLGEMELLGEMIQFRSPWSARMYDGKWEHWEITSMMVTQDAQPRDIGDGRVNFSMPFLGYCTLFPKGGSKLDPNNVLDLPSNSNRILSLYPNLVLLNQDVAKGILVAKKWPDQLEVLGPVDLKVSELLNSFFTEGSREEFLWYYIEAVTGEKVYQKVY